MMDRFHPMEKDQKTMTMKFVCKFCNKSYACGRALDIHLRSHRIGTSLNEEDHSRVEVSNDEKRDSGFEVGGSSGYGLRANPKKTRRFGDLSSVAFHQQGWSNVCKECGKGFQSMKALCGHMACHSEKASDWFEDDDDVIDQNGVGKKQFKPVMECDQSNGYSSVSEIEPEQEELAKCLMMLSRDDRSRRVPNSTSSLVLESKSSPIRVRVRAVEGLNGASGFDEIMVMKKLQKRKLKSAENRAGYGKSDSGYMKYEDGNHNSDSSIDEHVKIKELAKSIWGRNIDGAAHLEKKLDYKSESQNELAPRKRACKDRKVPENSPSGAGSFDFNFTDCKQKHQCDICYKQFDSRKALSGHKSASSSHRKVQPFHPAEPNREVSSIWSSKKPSSELKKNTGNKKNYRHECPICFRVFKSGQALGGHKRSHFLGSSEDRSVAFYPEINKVPSLIDLNLPAPLEEDANGNRGFMLC